MEIPLFFSTYLLWHYSIGLNDYMRVWGNFFWFNWHFFSIPLLLKTLFSPWRRLSEKARTPGLHPKEFVGELIINTLMRFIGFFVRLATLIMGCFVFVIITVLGILGLLIWLSAPIFIPFLLVESIYLFFV